MNRILYLEVLRVIAVYFVIFNHTGKDGFFLYTQYTSTSIQFWIYGVMSVFCKLSVPLYFMISGAIMLGRETEELKILWKKRIFRIFVVIVGSSALYNVVGILKGYGPFDARNFFVLLYSSEFKYHLWFLYLYIAYLIGLPFLQSMVKQLKTEYYMYIIVLQLLITGIIPVLESLFFDGSIHLNENINSIWLLSYVVIYPCVGFFLHNYKEISSKKILIMWGINICCMLLVVALTLYSSGVNGEILESNSQIFYENFVIMNCICVFVSVKQFFEQIELGANLKCLVYSMGASAFGIYLLHPIFLESRFWLIILSPIKRICMNPMLAALLACGIVLIACYIIVSALRRLGLIRKFI